MNPHAPTPQPPSAGPARALRRGASHRATRRSWLARLLAPWRELLPDVAAFLGALLCAVLAAVLAGSLGGCGGGVGTEGTGGFSVTSSAAGPITGFGSIVVNGVHFDETNARVEDDSALAQDAGKLALGMMVQVTGGAITTDASGRQSATATQVRYVRALVGPVGGVNLAAGTLSVLGQTVAIGADTVFDGALAKGSSTGLAALSAGQLVEVYGSFDASSQQLRATRIAAAASTAAYAVRGTVTAVNPDNKTFVIDGQTCSYAGLPDASALAVGAVLKVELKSERDSSGRYVAGSQQSGQSPSTTQDRENIKLQGLVGAVSSATRLVVEGVVVDIAGAKVSGTAVVGAQVEVSGALRSGVLVATELKVSNSGSARSYELEGRPTSLDLANKRLVLRGTTVSLARSDLVLKGVTLAQLSVSTKLRIVGVLSADRSVVDATLVELDN